jgi:hypothetical protein
MPLIANLRPGFCSGNLRKPRTIPKIFFSRQIPRLISTKKDYTLFDYRPFDDILKIGLFCLSR